MYALEIFLKKRKFSAIYKTVWPLVSAHVTYPPGTEGEPEQKLAFFGALSYGTVYQCALAAGMSTSAAHYMARLLLRNLKFEGWMNEAVIAIFAPSDEAERAYADAFLSRVASLVETLRAGGDAAAVEPAMDELSRLYRKVDFAPA